MHKIKKAEPQDIGLILSMIRELSQWEGYGNHVDASEEVLLESLFGPESISTVLIAYIDDQPVGYMICCPKISTYSGRNEIYLQDLYLRKEVRGSGLGLALMRKLADIALEANATRIEWLVVKNNTQAISFYEKLGADIVDDIKVVRLDGEGLMALANKTDHD